MLERQTVVVTGGAGFIGSNLIGKLVKLNFDVYSIDNYSVGTPNNHHPNVKYIESEIKDIKKITEELPQKIHWFFHFGEFSRVEQSFTKIDYVLKNNIQQFVDLLTFIQSRNVQKFIYSASSTIFTKENYAESSLSPYTLTKEINVNILNNYAKWNGINYAICYFYNAYGNNEIADGENATVIAKFLKLKAEGAACLPITSPGTQRRNFTHVDDIVDALLLVAEKGAGDGYPIGSNESYSILDVAKMLEMSVKLTPSVEGNRMNARLDNSKVMQLGWKPRHSLKNYIEKV